MPVRVTQNTKGVPTAFGWRGRELRIREIQERWRLTGAWWDGEGERTFFRVATDCGGIYELCFDHRQSAWTVEGVRD